MMSSDDKKGEMTSVHLINSDTKEVEGFYVYFQRYDDPNDEATNHLTLMETADGLWRGEGEATWELLAEEMQRRGLETKIRVRWGESRTIK